MHVYYKCVVATLPFTVCNLMTALCLPAGLPAVATMRGAITSRGTEQCPGLGSAAESLPRVGVMPEPQYLRGAETPCSQPAPRTATAGKCFDLSGHLPLHLAALGPLGILITPATFRFCAAATGRLLNGVQGRGVGADVGPAPENSSLKNAQRHTRC